MGGMKSEAKLTFGEATSLIVGHGVGSGILSVPYLASRNSWFDLIWVVAAVYGNQSAPPFYDCRAVLP